MVHIIPFTLLSVFANFIIVDLNKSLSNTINNALLMNLLQLNEKFCGNAALDNATSFLLESDENLFPMPCCTPCSCDPDFTRLRGCCPIRLIQTRDVPEKQTSDILSPTRHQASLSGSDAEAVLNDDDVTPEYLEKENNISQMTQKSDVSQGTMKNGVSLVTKENDVSQVMKENNITQMMKENNVSHVIKGNDVSQVMKKNNVSQVMKENNVSQVTKENNISQVIKENNVWQVTKENNVSQMMKENNVSQVTKGNDVSQVMKENNVSQVMKENNISQVMKENNVSQVMKENSISQVTEINPKTVCIRPQTFYNPNEYINSIAYEMVVSCPVSFMNDSTKNKCRKGFESTNIADIIPVTSSITGSTYVNKHCLLCNELRNVDEDSAHFWQPVFVYKHKIYTHIPYGNPETILSFFQPRSYYANIHFLPSIPNLARKCHAFDIGTCNQTGLWQANDEHIKILCESALSLIVIHKISNQRKMFKNIACLHCNTGKDFPDKSCGYFRSIQNVFVYSMSLNVQNLLRSRQRETKDEITELYMNKSTLMYLTNPLCPAGHVDIMNFCRPVVCPRDHIMNGGYCRPLYDILSGMNLHFKLQVIVDHSIKEDLRQEFAETIYPVVNYTLKRTVNLQILENSLWFLPGSRERPVDYYLFSVYLFNSSNEIKYSRAIKEINTFFQTIKTTSYLALGDGKIAALTYQFGHQVIRHKFNLVDASKGKNGQLYPMMEKERISKEHGSSMTISNSNWCYRTFLAAKEVERNLVVYRIKNSDIFLYQDQFDEYGTHIAVCMDLVSNVGGSREKRPNVAVTSVTGLEENYDYNNVTPWYLSKEFILTVFVLCTTLFFIAFCKIKSFCAKHRERITMAQN